MPVAMVTTRCESKKVEKPSGRAAAGKYCKSALCGARQDLFGAIRCVVETKPNTKKKNPSQPFLVHLIACRINVALFW